MPGIFCQKMRPQDVCYISYLKEYSVIWFYEELYSSPIVYFGLLVMFWKDIYCNKDVLVCISYHIVDLEIFYTDFLNSSLYSFCVPAHCFIAVIDRKYFGIAVLQKKNIKRYLQISWHIFFSRYKKNQCDNINFILYYIELKSSFTHLHHIHAFIYHGWYISLQASFILPSFSLYILRTKGWNYSGSR